MKNARSLKLQSLLITQLLKEGSVELILPDGIKLEIGITQEDKFGNKEKADDYCYVVANRDGKSFLLDSHVLGLLYEDEKDTIVFEDKALGNGGVPLNSLEIV